MRVGLSVWHKGKQLLVWIFHILTHWGWVTYICVGKLTIIGSDNGLSPGRRQTIIWTNAGMLLIRPLGTNFNKTLIEILTFSFMKMRLKVSAAKWRPFCLGLNVLIPYKIILYFVNLIFMSAIVLLILDITSAPSFYIDVVLTLSISKWYVA